MQPFRQLLPFDWRLLLVPSIVVAATLVIAYAVKALTVRLLRRLKAPAGQHCCECSCREARRPVLDLGGDHRHLPGRRIFRPPAQDRAPGRTHAGNSLDHLADVDRSAAWPGNLVRHFGMRLRGTTQVTSLTQNLAQLCVACLGGSVLMHYLGISVVPILTALGVGGLAVALALQDTLSNLFAGFYVTMAGQVRPGDYIRLSTGEEGYVSDISWRSTTIRTLNNNLIIIPNAKLAQAIVTNFHLPERRTAVNIPVGVAYGTDPERVEQILLEEVQAAMGKIPGLIADPPPNVRLIPGFGDSSLNFTLGCFVAEFVDQFLVQHELRKRILRRFQQEGIEIPFPTLELFL